MVESSSYDDIDRRIVHALQIDGRAPFSRIAAALGVSDQTVARRYVRLRSADKVRVVGLTEPRALGEIRWFIRVRCTPDVASSVASAIARRPDASWVSLTSGGTEIVCVARSADGDDALLLQKLPRTRGVVDVTAHCLMHEFFGGPLGLMSKSGPLSADEAAQLEAPAPASPPSGAPFVLSDGDQRMLAVLQQDGRAGLGELAAATGWSASSVRRRLAELRGTGVLYFDVDYDWRMLGVRMRAMLWLTAAPAKVPAVGEALAKHPEVPFAAATTGPTNLCASVVCPDTPALYRYLTTRVATLPAVQRVETAPVIRTIKGASQVSSPPRSAVS